MKNIHMKPGALFRQRPFLTLATATVLLLAACSGGGGGDGGAGAGGGKAGSGSATQDANNNPVPPVVTSSNLFVADALNNAVASFVGFGISIGTTDQSRVISGTNTRITSAVEGMAIDKVADRLYVVHKTEILVFDKAGQIKGNIAPSRILASSASSSFSAPFLDTDNDRLYVLDKDQLKILVFDNASTSVNAAPARSITVSLPVVSLSGLAIDLTRNILYASFDTTSVCKIGVFENASSLNGVATANRFIDACGIDKMAIDPLKDRLYTVDGSTSVGLIDQASTSSAALISLPLFFFWPSSGLRDLALDAANDTLYTIDSVKIYQIKDVSAATPANVTFSARADSAAIDLKAIAVK
jgi:hypothetical protein